MTTTLLVIDFINDIAAPKGKIARAAERILKNHTIAHANQVIAYARKREWPIIFVKVGFHPGYPECPKNSPLFGPAATHGALLLGAWGTEFHPELAITPQDLVMVKHRVSCFYATPLEAFLRAQQTKTLLLTGTSTNMTIEHTARDAHDRDYDVIIIEDACEAPTEEAHRSSLESLRRIAQVIPLTTLLQNTHTIPSIK